ncbi:MAG TPA: hypothetical protein VNM15_06165 [Candidatus Binatia bacterium]|nr:hypothetical protein [Candidatus Binatia bacterium]
MATVIDAADEVIVLPKLSWTATVGGPATELPTVELPGWTVKASLAALPAETLKLALVAPVSPLADAVSV